MGQLEAAIEPRTTYDPDDDVDASLNINSPLVNPFVGKTHNEMNDLIDAFMEKTKIDEIYSEYVRKGAFLAQDSEAFDDDREDGLQLKQEERAAMILEDPKRGSKWNQPWILYALVGCCSLGAAVQGWDETAVNGGTINPVLRRPMLQLTTAFTNTWWHLFIARFILGLGIGPKSATIPIYAAECTPANIRGALVMMWQMWTAFGIMLGYIAGVVFRSVLDGDSATCPNSLSGTPQESILRSVRCSLNWRLMLASPMILPLVAVAYVYTLPESPRWLLSKARQGKTEKFEAAFTSLCRLRHTRLQAARDLFLMHHLLDNEEKIKKNHTVFSDAGLKGQEPLLASMGFGIINFVFAIPAFYTIDTLGRRNLLLCTFPFMAIFQLLTGLGFLLDGKAQLAMVMVGMYLFSVAYSPGEGPVPFLYSAESMPLYVRDVGKWRPYRWGRTVFTRAEFGTGMSMATALTWFFNFLLAVTFPKFQDAFHNTGAFGYYAAWCVVGWVLILLFVPETKDLTLEQLDARFSISSKSHAKYALKQCIYAIRRYVLRRQHVKRPVIDLPPQEDDYGHKEADRPRKISFDRDERMPGLAS
ncbi:MAG: hypothetical protein Q9218_003171 [Villophora microphyllina]